ncbi:MAG: AAA family ATPase [Oscillospiraceae bacterium]|nr:AAA family ATPase [Oscillospiraceae bacterium]
MFTYIKLKNFLSFQEVVFDLKKSSKNTKSFTAIYGENGSGKSNLIRSIRFLCQSMISLKLKVENDKISIPTKQMGIESMKSMFQRIMELGSLSQSFVEYRMVECDEPTEAEYGFIHEGIEGFYKIVFTDRIIEESLYWLRGKQRGLLFRLTAGEEGAISTEFYSSLFLQRKTEKDIMDEIEKYWGIHSFMSILWNYIDEKNYKFITDNISESILSLISYFRCITVVTKEPQNHRGLMSQYPGGILKRLDSGTVPAKDRQILEKTERIVRSFIVQAYADIKDAYYKTESMSEDYLYYQLYVVKMIGGKPREISFENESAGTQKVLEVIEALIGVFFGVVVAYDEIDNGVHDLLLQHILGSLEDEITGQLIITTHNTMLMQSMSPHNVYVIQVDYMGNKEIHCLGEYSIQKNHNMQNVYLKGLVGGTPYLDFIDYDFLRDELDTEGGTCL